MSKTASPETLREALNLAMVWLDPHTGRNVDLVSCQNAYDLLLRRLTDSDDSNMTLASRLACSLVEFSSNVNSSSFREWLECQMDLYRALILASSLCIQLTIQEVSSRKNTDDDKSKSKTTLEDTIENCLQLLCLLCDVQKVIQLPDCILPSRYPLLQALLEEPLLPLDSEEARQELWRFDPSGDCGTVPTSAMDESEVDNENSVPMIGFPSKRELVHEERELIDMASTPIPEVVLDDDNRRSSTCSGIGGEPILQDRHILSAQVRKDNHSPSSIVVMKECVLQIHAYGVLLLIEKGHQQPPSSSKRMNARNYPTSPKTSTRDSLCLPHSFAVEGIPEERSFVLEVTSSSEGNVLLLKLTVRNLKQGLRIIQCLQQTQNHLQAMNTIRGKLHKR